MTLQELIQYIVDRVDTNENFAVSALDVQEAIVQTATELWNRPADVTPQDLQSVLDEGNEADTNSFINMVLKKLNVSNTIDENGLVVVDTTSGTQTISVDLTNGFKIRRDFPDGSVMDYKNLGLGEEVNISGATLGYTSVVNEQYTPTGQSYTIETSDSSTRIEKQVTPNLLTYKGNVSDGYYDNHYSLGFLNIEGREFLSGSFYQIRYDNSSDSPKGRGGIGLTTDFSNKDFQPLATFDVDGDIRAGVIEEEASEPDYFIVPSSDNVLKKKPIKKDEFELISKDGGETFFLDKLYTSLNVQVNTAGDVSVILPNPLTEEHVGDWYFFNTGTVGSGNIIVSSIDPNGVYNSGDITPSKGLLIKIIRVRTGTNAFVSKIIELQKN